MANSSQTVEMRSVFLAALPLGAFPILILPCSATFEASGHGHIEYPIRHIPRSVSSFDEIFINNEKWLYTVESRPSPNLLPLLYVLTEVSRYWKPTTKDISASRYWFKRPLGQRKLFLGPG